MAEERKSPDGVTFTLTALTGAYTDVDDDPDSPDGLWLVADNNNVNTAVLTSFPTPTGNPTVGADLQNFRVLVRQFDEGQGGTPEARIELWENGVLVRAGNDVNVPDGGIVIEFTWNANELGTADGSLVECKVVGTKAGGSPSNRNSVEVGAIEWNVTYDAAGSDFEYTGSGSFIYSGTATQTYSKNFLYTASGQLTYSGSATQVYSKNYLYEGSGSLAFSGDAVIIMGLAYVGSGSLAYSGEAIITYTLNYLCTAIGELIYSGEAIFSYLCNFLFTGSGEFAYSGSADCSYEGGGDYEYVGSGSYVFNGTALQSYTKIFSYSGSGNFIFSGESSYELGFSYVGSGTYTFSGAGLYVLGLFYVGAGNTLWFSGSGIYYYVPIFSHIGSGQFIHSGVAICSYEIAGFMEIITFPSHITKGIILNSNITKEIMLNSGITKEIILPSKIHLEEN